MEFEKETMALHLDFTLRDLESLHRNEGWQVQEWREDFVILCRLIIKKVEQYGN